jgi:hypothetical protein
MAGFDKAALERLMALGRRRGHLTTGDLESELPVGGMEPDEIALVIVHLEEAGIPVDVDAALLAGERRPAALPPDDAGLVLPNPPVEAPPTLFAGAEGAAAPVRPAPDAATPASGRWSYAHLAVAIAGAAVLLLLAAFLALSPWG